MGNSVRANTHLCIQRHILISLAIPREYCFFHKWWLSGWVGGGGGEGGWAVVGAVGGGRMVVVVVIVKYIQRTLWDSSQKLLQRPRYASPSFTYPLTARVVQAPKMTSQPVSSMSLCSPLPPGTWWTLGLSIPWCCLPNASSVCRVIFTLSHFPERQFCPDLMNGTQVCHSANTWDVLLERLSVVKDDAKAARTGGEKENNVDTINPHRLSERRVI